MGGFSFLRWGDEVQRDAARQRWDTETAAHVECVRDASLREETISIQDARFARDERFIGLIAGLVSLGRPESDFVKKAQAQIAAEREHLVADRIVFAEQRPPLDPAQCPPAPAGPRP